MGNQMSQSDDKKQILTIMDEKSNNALSLPSLPHVQLPSNSAPSISSNPTPSLASLPSYSTTITPIIHQNYSSSKSSSMASKNVNSVNGLVGVYLSQNIAEIAVNFWRENIESLCMEAQLEIGCSIFFGMRPINKHAESVIKTKLKNGKMKIEHLSLKFLDTFGYLTRNLLRNDINLYSSLSSLHMIHKRMGININHFSSMLISMHETFSYYFNKQYTFQVKYAVEELFSVAAKIICNNKAEIIPIKDIHFHIYDEPIESLEVYLKSLVGRECLFRFLKQKSCHHIVLFLELIYILKLQMTDKQRYITARDIVKRCFLQNSINQTISAQNVQNILDKMNQVERSFLLKQDFMFPFDFFDDVEYEVYKVIMKNYWKEFVLNVKKINV